MTIVPAGADHGAAIDLLLDDVFGKERHGRTAYRLREGAAPIDELCLVALHDDGTLAGSIQLWPLEFVEDSGAVHALTLLGPVAVSKAEQGNGIGAALMEAAIARAKTIGREAIVLIGDPEYYGRFGFTAEATAGWRVPGPVERHRLLAKLPPERAARLKVSGALRPSRRLSAVPATTPAQRPPLQAKAPAAA